MAEEPRSRGGEYARQDTWHVVLDTNEMFRDFRLRHPETIFLLANAQPPSFRLCVPEIVVREMVNQFQEALTAAHERLAAAERELGNLLGRAISQRVDANAIRSAGVRYDAELREILASHGVSIEPLPAELSTIRQRTRRPPPAQERRWPKSTILQISRAI
jgi:hypothetical protein